MSENSTRTPPVDSRAIASKNAPADFLASLMSSLDGGWTTAPS